MSDMLWLVGGIVVFLAAFPFLFKWANRAMDAYEDWCARIVGQSDE